MKISPVLIIRDHLETLRNVESGKRSVSDLLLFYAVPALVAVTSYWTICLSDNEFYSVSITFFGIFVALLLNIQVAAFGIFQRKWSRSSDDRLAEIADQDANIRVQLLREINANISYAVLISCFALFLFISFYGLNFTANISTSVGSFIYLHFLLTLLMIIKRSHVLFRKEYDSGI